MIDIRLNQPLPTHQTTEGTISSSGAQPMDTTLLPSQTLAWALGYTSFEAALASGLELQKLEYPILPESAESFMKLGAGKQPIVAHVPHAGFYRTQDHVLSASPDAFQSNASLLTDWFTDDLFSAIYDTNDSHGLKGSALINRLNRFYFDPERYDDRTQEPMESVGMGVFYSHGCNRETLRPTLSDEDYQHLLNRYYYPYHNTLSEMCLNAYAQFGELVIVDCHAYPENSLSYETNLKAKRPDICLGVNNPSSSQALIDFWRAQCDQWGLSFAVNEPFAGALIPPSVQGKPNMLGFMIEVNKKTYMHQQHALHTEYHRIKDFLSQSLSACMAQRSALYNGG